VGSTINQLVEQTVRAGVGGPCRVGAGLVIIETKGRKSGKRRSTPVLAQRFGDSLFVSTVRTDSQWIRNLEADEAPEVFVEKRSRPVKVFSRRFGGWTVLRLQLVD
jgi:F420H(2)-dependent quinone reductase